MREREKEKIVWPDPSRLPFVLSKTKTSKMDQNVYKAQLILILADKICAAASIIGSVFIIRDIKKRWDRKKSNEHLPPTLYQLAHTAVADIGYSLFPHFLNS